jgi:regulatory protein
MKKENIPEWILKKIYRYCGYQERSQYDVEKKLKELPIAEELVEIVILHLRKENFINDERYATLFARGKFYNNKWGRNKILYELRKKKIPSLFIEEGLNEISDKECGEMLFQILRKKNISLREKDKVKRRYKLYTFAAGKGYEKTLTKKVVDKLLD